MNTAKTIVMTSELLDDQASLSTTLATLYKGTKDTYRIYLSLAQLPIVEEIFDVIIKENGVRDDVQFEYKLRT
jgi:hypothetical protein